MLALQDEKGKKANNNIPRVSYIPACAAALRAAAPRVIISFVQSPAITIDIHSNFLPINVAAINAVTAKSVIGVILSVDVILRAGNSN